MKKARKRKNWRATDTMSVEFMKSVHCDMRLFDKVLGAAMRIPSYDATDENTPYK